jgi:hypothetical protein
MTKKKERDIEKTYTTKQVVAKLRRLADSLENGKQYKIQIAGEKISIPTKAVFNIEHERGKKPKKSNSNSNGNYELTPRPCDTQNISLQSSITIELHIVASYTLRTRSPPQHLSLGNVPDT